MKYLNIASRAYLLVKQCFSTSALLTFGPDGSLLGGAVPCNSVCLQVSMTSVH